MFSDVSFIAIGNKAKNGSFSECSLANPICCFWWWGWRWLYLLWISVYTWFLRQHHQYHRVQSLASRSVLVAWNDCPGPAVYPIWLHSHGDYSATYFPITTWPMQSNSILVPLCPSCAPSVQSMCRFTFGWMNHDELMRIRAWTSPYSRRFSTAVCVDWNICGQYWSMFVTSLYSFIVSKNKLLYNTNQVFQMSRVTCFHMRCCSKINRTPWRCAVWKWNLNCVKMQVCEMQLLGYV